MRKRQITYFLFLNNTVVQNEEICLTLFEAEVLHPLVILKQKESRCDYEV